MATRKLALLFPDDDDELTDLDTSDEEEERESLSLPPLPPIPHTPTLSVERQAKSTRPSTQKATQESRQRLGLNNKAPNTTLNPPRTTTYSISSLNDWIEQDLLDLNAEYQRGVVWNESKQTHLLDSLFRNFHVPSIVFAYTMQPHDGKELRICIDGKQRLTSIHRFMKGEIAYKDPVTQQKLYFYNPDGSKSRRKCLSPQIQAVFRNKQISCVEYSNVTCEQEREIFQRVQLGMPLGPSDRLPAINGPCADLIRGLRKSIDEKDGLQGYLDWGTTRGKDFQALAQIVYLIENGHEPRKAEPTASRLEAFLQQGKDMAHLRNKAHKAMDIYCRIIRHPRHGGPLAIDLAPLEFVLAAYLIHLYHLTYNDVELSVAISCMRNSIRQLDPSRKFKTGPFKQALQFVRTQVPKLKSQKKLIMDTQEIKTVPRPIPSAKRKHEEADGDDGESDIIVLKKVKATPAKQKDEANASAQSTSRASAAIASIAARAGKSRTTVKKSPAKQAQVVISTSESTRTAIAASRDDMDTGTSQVIGSVLPPRILASIPRYSRPIVMNLEKAETSLPSSSTTINVITAPEITTANIVASGRLLPPSIVTSNSKDRLANLRQAKAKSKAPLVRNTESSSGERELGTEAIRGSSRKQYAHLRFNRNPTNSSINSTPESPSVSPSPGPPEWLIGLQNLYNNVVNRSPTNLVNVTNPVQSNPKTANSNPSFSSVTQDPRTRPISNAVAQSQNLQSRNSPPMSFRTRHSTVARAKSPSSSLSPASCECSAVHFMHEKNQGKTKRR